MHYWLVKSEPYEYSYQDLVEEGRTAWTGVRNYAARKHLRAMKKDDLVLYYHSRKGLEVVGIAKVIREAYPDETAEKGDWSAVDLVPVQALYRPVSLKEIKTTEGLGEMPLVKIGRLSVMPISPKEFSMILKLGQTDGFEV